MYEGDIEYEAFKWQGYDTFPGKDEYHSKVLKAGTLLAKLEPSGSGYFFEYEELEKAMKDGKISSTILSEGLQVAYFKNSDKQYVYRPKVTVYKLEHDIEVAYGDTIANKEYGNGGLKQFYIPDYKARMNSDGKLIPDIKKNKELGLILDKSYSLIDVTILKEEVDLIKDKHNQHLNKRNLFCCLKTQDQLIKIASLTDDVNIKNNCMKRCNELNEQIDDYYEDIKESEKKIGKVHSFTYDEKVNYYAEKNYALLNGLFFEKNSKIEKESNKIFTDIIGKIHEEKINEKEFRIIKIKENLKGDYKSKNPKLCEINDCLETNYFCINEKDKILQEVNKNINKIKDIKRDFSNINNNDILIRRSKEYLNVIKEKQPVINKCNNKIFGAKKYAENHKDDILKYNAAINELRKFGINNEKDILLIEQKNNALKIQYKNNVNNLKSNVLVKNKNISEKDLNSVLVALENKKNKLSSSNFSNNINNKSIDKKINSKSHDSKKNSNTLNNASIKSVSRQQRV